MLDAEIKLGRKTDRPEHPDRVFADSCCRVTDGADEFLLEILHSADVVDDGKVGNIIGKGIDSKITAPGIFLGRAEKIVPEQHAVVTFQQMSVFTRHLLERRIFRAFRVSFSFRLVIFRRVSAFTECCQLDDFVFEVEVRKPETPSNKTTVAEQFFDFRRGCVSCQVKIFRCPLEEQVTDRSADQEGFVAVVTEAIHDSQGIGADKAPGDVVAGAPDGDRELSMHQCCSLGAVVLVAGSGRVK